MATLDLSENVKCLAPLSAASHSVPVGAAAAVAVSRSRTVFTIPHRYQRYQQTILSKTLLPYQRDGGRDNDKITAKRTALGLAEPIRVQGMKIHRQLTRTKSEGDGEADEKQQQLIDGQAIGTGNEELEDAADNRYHLMDAMGETNINFYDFRRTWSIEEYSTTDDDDDNNKDLRHRPPAFFHSSNRNNCSIRRTPSPKTKQIIRVNVIKMANR